MYGVNFNIGLGGSTPAVSNMFVPNAVQGNVELFDNCAIALLSSNSNIQTCGATTIGLTRFNNCPITTSYANNTIGLDGNFEWLNTPSAINGTMPTNLISVLSNYMGIALIKNCDFSGVGSGKVLAFNSGGSRGYLVFQNCKINASVTIANAQGSIGSGLGFMVDVLDCDSGATNYRNERWSSLGSLTTNTSIYRTGGASDGVTPFSWAINPNYSRWYNPITTFPLAVQNYNITSNVTITVEGICNKTVVANNDTAWITVNYYSNAASPQITTYSNTKGTFLDTGVIQSNTGWTVNTASDTPSGNVLSFANTWVISNGDVVFNTANVSNGTIVSSVINATSVQLSNSVLGDVPLGTPITLLRAWDAGVAGRVNSHAYALGSVIVVPDNPGVLYFCTLAGNTAASEPAGYAYQSNADGASITETGATGTAAHFTAGYRFKMSVTTPTPPTMVGPITATIQLANTAAGNLFWIDPMILLS